MVEFILAKVREVFPEGKGTLRECLATYEHNFTIFGTLDVVPQLEVIQEHYGKICAAWGLRLPDEISRQTKEAKELLYKLLKATK